MNNYTLTPQEVQLAQSRFYTKVYLWMSLALIVTGITSMYVATNTEIMSAIFGNRFGSLILFGMSFGLSYYIQSKMMSISEITATLLFLLYSVVIGVMISWIFLVYTSGSIASTFFITAGTFAGMSAFGYFTKTDLTTWKNILMTAFLGIVIASVINVFWQNDTFSWITSCLGVLVFSGLIAYHTQQIKENATLDVDDATKNKIAILGALSLYINFINLFMSLLRLFGGRRD
jgi:uncharacterized protein